MKCRVKNLLVSQQRGYTMLEVLVVAGIIGILSTIPIAAVHSAKVKANEVEAIAALNMMAVAYESYSAQTRPHHYPNYVRQDYLEPGLIDYQNAEDIWEDLLNRSLIPKRFSNHRFDENDLLARGFKLSILAYSRIPSYSNSPRYTYGIIMKPHQTSQQPRAIAIFQGYNDGWIRISARARKLPGTGDRSKSKFYTWKDF